MTQLQQNRYDQLLRRVADLKGPGSKVNDVLTELFPMIDVENPPAELLVLMGSRIAIGSINQPAPGALLFEQHMLSNPVGSGAIITLLECVTSCSNTNQRIGYGLTQNTLAGTALEAFTDGRAFPDGTIGKVLHAGELVTGVTFGQMRCIAAVNLFISPPRAMAVLSPGTAFSVTTTVVDTPLTTTFWWIERQAQPSELNL